MLLLKISLVPLLILFASLIARQCGPKLAGLVTGLPLVAGPISLFIALEQGAVFAANSVPVTLQSIASVAVFCLLYSWLAERTHWLVSLSLALCSYGFGAWLIFYFPLAGGLNFVFSAVVVGVCFFLLPRPVKPLRKTAFDTKEIPLRMLFAAGLVLSVTHLAETSGPRLSGVLTVFPVATVVMAVFSHRQGADHLQNLLWGLMLGLFGLCLFYAVLAWALPKGIAMGFGIALLVVLLYQLLVSQLSISR